MSDSLTPPPGGAGRWRRVTGRRPCPACGHKDWCAWTPDGRALKCERTALPPEGMTVGKPCDGGALFVLAEEGRSNRRRAPAGLKDRPPLDWAASAEQCRRAITPEQLAGLAGALGVSSDALERIGTGWAGADDVRALRGGWKGLPPAEVFTFPERDAGGSVIGLQLRAPDGRKSQPAGGKRGLIIPDGLAGLPDPVLLVEGASDVAACLTLGVAAVGRPSNRGGAEHVAALLKGRKCLVVGENDRKPGGLWPGRDGAEGLARAVAEAWSLPVRWALPPDEVKDVRQWVQHIGGTGAALLEALNGAAVTVEPEPVTVCLTDVREERIDWLWPNRLARGKVAVFAGMPDVGKSWTTCDLAARVSSGSPWPDLPGLSRPPAGVVLVNGEDALADTLKPRLATAGADHAYIRAVPLVDGAGSRTVKWFTLDDLPRLERAVAECVGACGSCDLIVIDPASAFLGDREENSNAEVRSLLGPLGAFAARHRCAIVLVTHVGKRASPSAMQRVLGSTAWTAAVRLGWMFRRCTEDPDRREMLRMKGNIIADGTAGLAYRIQGDPPLLVWDPEPVHMSADDALAAEMGGEVGGAREDAVAWLREALQAGPRLSTELLEEAEQEGIAKRTLWRAKKALEVRATREGFGGPWVWVLPESRSVPPEPKPAMRESVAPFDEGGTLRIAGPHDPADSISELQRLWASVDRPAGGAA